MESIMQGIYSFAERRCDQAIKEIIACDRRLSIKHRALMKDDSNHEWMTQLPVEKYIIRDFLNMMAEEARGYHVSYEKLLHLCGSDMHKWSYDTAGDPVDQCLYFLSNSSHLEHDGKYPEYLNKLVNAYYDLSRLLVVLDDYKSDSMTNNNSFTSDKIPRMDSIDNISTTY